MKSTPVFSLVLAALLSLTGCGNIQLFSTSAGDVLDQKLEKQEATKLDTLANHNRLVRDGLSGAVMNVPPRAGSGFVSEIEVDQVMRDASPTSGIKGTSARRGSGAAGGGKAQHLRLDFADTSLKDIITVFLQEYLKVPFSFAEGFKDKKANLYFDAEAGREEMLELFDNLLDNYGARLRFSGGVYVVTSTEDKSPIGPTPLRVGDAVGLIRLRYIDAQGFLPLAKQVVRDQNKVVSLGTTAVVVTAAGSDLRAVRLLAQDLDVPTFAGKYIVIYVPKYLPATGLVAMLDNYQNQLLGNVQSGAKQFESKQVADSDRIIIVAANKIARDLVFEFLTKADQPDRNKRQIFQYPLGTQLAADVATNVNTLLKAVLKNVTDIAVVPDKASNSLFIFASPEEFGEIRKLLERMDYRPPAVHIDMSIAEVRLNNNMQFGVDWFLRKKGAPLLEVGSDQKLGLTKGLQLGLLGGGDSANFLIFELLAAETTFSLLSSPQLVVKNGATAKITSGTEQPIVKGKVTSGTNTSGTAIATSQVEYQKIGLELEVTPWVTNNNEVRLTIKLKDSTNAGDVTIDGNKYPRLSTRDLSTELITADRQTIFLGGIRRQTLNESRSKIPGAGDIETWGLGNLFGNKSEETDGSELIILARPSIILDQQGADIVTRALLNASKESLNFSPPPRVQGKAPPPAKDEVAPAGSAPAVPLPLDQ